MSRKLSVKDFVGHDSNPFFVDLDSFSHIDYKHKNAAIEVVDVASGEVMDLTKYGKTTAYFRDGDKYVKLFVERLFPCIRGFNNYSLQMLFYVLMKLKVNRDLVTIEQKDFLSACGYSPTSKKVFFEALVGLLDAKLIAKSSRSKVYYINPTLFFNGNRVNLLSGEDKAVIRNK